MQPIEYDQIFWINLPKISWKCDDSIRIENVKYSLKMQRKL
jgi:hypothetical protein